MTNVRRLGIFHNLAYSAASPISISGNTITGTSNANEGKWDGIMLASLSVPSSATGNTITATTVTQPASGVNVWNVKSTSPTAISGGSVTDASTGVFVNNYDGYSSDASDGAHATISGITINTRSGGAGIRIFDNPLATSNANVQAAIGAGVIINNGANGLVVENSTASVTAFGNVAFAGQTGDYIKLIDNAGNIDATTASFAGTTGGAATLAQNFAIEDKISHKIDVGALGFVLVKANNDFVTTNSFITPATTTASVQRAVDAASSGFTVNVANGTYNGDVTINQSVTVLGQSTAAIIRGLYAGSTKTVTVTANNVTVKDVTITRDYGLSFNSNPGNDWVSSLKTEGIIAENLTGLVLDHIIVTGNRNGVYIHSVPGFIVRNSTVSDNRTGFQIWGNLDNGQIVNNFITNNFTHGLLVNFDQGPTTGNNLLINNNDMSGNWQSQLHFQNGGAPGSNVGSFTNFNANCNWYGSLFPAYDATNASYPGTGYTAQNPSQFGGTDPGLVSDIRGQEAALITYTPYLQSGVDASPADGFQPTGVCAVLNDLYVNDALTPGDITTAAGSDATGNGTIGAPFATITRAMLSAPPTGATIHVDQGVYSEQVNVNKSVVIDGQGSTGPVVTRLKAPAVPVTFNNVNGNYAAVIYASGIGRLATVSDIFVDGDGGRSATNYTGIYYFQAGGTISGNKVSGFRDPVYSGNQSGNAIYVNHTFDTPLSQMVTISNNTISDYQKTGILVNEINTHAIITGNTITGQNIPNMNAQNGIQIGYGAYATITGNTITGNLWNSANPHVYMASAILLAGAGVDMSNTATGNATVIGGAGLLANNINGNESGIQTGDGGYGYVNSKTVSYNGDNYTNNKVHVSLDQTDPVNVPVVANSYDKRVDNPAQTNTVFGSIQYGVDFAAAGNTLNASAGTFAENVVVHTPVSINGAGQASTFVIPEISNPNCGGGGGSLCAGASNVFLVQANSVQIQNLTVDGDNPALPGGIVVGGANVDARNGIITNHTLGVYNNLDVNNVTVKNVFLRGIYASSGGSFTFNNNTVTNVQGAPAGSIAIFNFGGAGTFSNNTVSNSSDGIVSNWSKGSAYFGNTATNIAGVGIHTDNNGGSGGIADTIRNNTVTNSPAGGYGIMVFAPYQPVQVFENTITNVEVALTNAGQNAAVTPLFTRNVIDGQSKANSIGVYQTTSLFGFGSSNVSGIFTNNYITNNASSGLYLETEPTFASDIVANNNSITGNTIAVDTTGTGTATRNMTCNWWGVTGGNALVAAVGKATNYAPWLKTAVDAQPGTIGFQPGGICGYDDDLYVNDNDGGNGYTTAAGNDANPGVPAAPLRTINKAIAVAQPAGNTVWVDAGSYAENVVANKSITFKGRQAGNINLTARNSAFISGKANPTLESVLTTPVNNPVNNPNDIVKLLSNGIMFDGFVLDGNNDTIPTASSVIGAGIDIDGRRAFTNVNAVGAGSVVNINNLTVKNNIIQNIAQRGVSLSSTGVALTGNLIDRNLIRSYGWDPVNGGQAVILFTNAYANVTNNTINVPVDQIGLHLQNFYSNGTMNWSNNNVTVGQDAIGIHANLFYAPAGVLNIQNNTVNAATGVTGASDYTWGINVWSVQNGSTVNVNSNTVGASGGEFGRGINLWNLPTGNTVTVNAGTVAKSVVGVNLDNVDPYFGVGSNTMVNVTGNPVVTAASGQTGIRARSAMVGIVAPGGAVTLNLNNATVNTSGTGIGVSVDAASANTSNTATVYLAGGTVISGGSTKPVSINGDQAQLYAGTSTITAPASGANNAIQFSGITAANSRENLVLAGGTTIGMNANTAARAFASPQYSIVEMDAAGGWAVPSKITGGLQTVLIDGKIKFSNGVLSTAVVADTIEFGNNAADIMTGANPEKATSYILGRAKMLSRVVANNAVDMLGAKLSAEAGVPADLGNLVISRTTSTSGAINPAFPSNASIRTVWNINPSNTTASRTAVQYRYLNLGTNINGQNPATIYAYRHTAGSWTKISASLSSSLAGDIYTTSVFNAPSFSPWTLSSQTTLVSPDLTPSVVFEDLNFTVPQVGVPRDFIVSIDEIAGVSTSGTITFRILKRSAFTITYSLTSGISNIFGGIPNSNSNWTFNETATFIDVSSNLPIPGTTGKIVGFSIQRKPAIPNGTAQSISALIRSGLGGGETNTSNNSAVVIINAN